MPCFSCSCFSNGRGRSKERLNGGRGYCELHDQEYWYGHECSDYAPTWYAPQKKERAAAPEARRKVNAVKGADANLSAAALWCETVDAHAALLRKEMDALLHATEVKPFFESLSKAIAHAQILVKMNADTGLDDDWNEVLSGLHGTDACVVQDFIGRCYYAGDLAEKKDEIMRYKHMMNLNDLKLLHDALEELSGEGEDEYEREERLEKELCEKLRGEISIDEEFWSENGLEFRCNLVTSVSGLRLNYETKRVDRKKMPEGRDLVLKVLFYDNEGNLLNIEEQALYAYEIARKHYAEYFAIDYNSVEGADRVVIEAYWEED